YMKKQEVILPEGRKGVQRIDEMERQAHEGGPYGVTAEEETEKMKPEIVLLPEPARVLEGDTARFRCRVTGYPAPKVNWYLNGQLIRKSKRYRLRYDGIYYLEITEIKSYDSGEVKVIADNNLGSAEHTVKLEIQQKEDFRTHLRHAAEPKPGDVPSESGKVSFEVVKAEQTAEDSQLKEVVKLKKAQRIVHEKSVEESEELRSKFKRRTEEGYYESITAVELKSRKRDDSYEDLTFTHTAVKIKKTLKNLNVVETQEAVFSLELTHENVRGVQWIKNGIEIQPSDKFEISMEGMVHTLKIKNCSTQDESVYSFKLGKLSCSAHLTVEFSAVSAALRVTRPMKNVEVPETQVATFECEVSHFSVPSTWLKNGVELEMSEKFRIVVQGRLHQLKIMNTSRDDSAEYTFVCGNDRVGRPLSVRFLSRTSR
uniref:Ig-like domain-containing protein n=1 Tax=Fundulus heteroclitus TaxID=8078 RepID=A0A3Q2NT28_FUNHE